jgi:hypothetical protein
MQKADPAARARLLRWLLPIGGLGLLLAAGLTTLTEWLLDSAPIAWLFALLAILFGIGIAMLWPLRLLWLSGHASIAARRFPAPGQAVVRDVVIRSGEAAVLQGRLLQVLAVVLAVFVLLTPTAIAWLFYRLAV